MTEKQSIREAEPKPTLADQVREVFERRAAAGERKLILETYKEGFEKLLMTIPPEKRDTIAVQIQKLFVTIGGALSEYGSRFVDFVRNTTVFPMLLATKDFPKDKYYQLNLAGAQAWGEFALKTTKTATAERMLYRDKFLPAAITGVPMGGLIGAVSIGAYEGIQYGAVAGIQGAVAGAVVGAIGGGILAGGTSLFYKVKDALIGPPVLYYGLYTFKAPGIDASKVASSLWSGRPFA
jgi:hypothetical protein